MYAVIRAYSGNRELADTLAEHTDDIRQVIGGINGFKAYYLLKIAEGTTTISVFEDQAGAEESNRAAAAWLAENLPDLEVAAPYVTAGEVLVGFLVAEPSPALLGTPGRASLRMSRAGPRGGEALRHVVRL
jgi:hypothetical protein